MQSNLYIPEQIHVGFQKREGTFTGKLGYVIFKDNKGVLRQEKSWQGWRDQSIEPIVFDNTPSRFVLNKGVQRHGYFGSGRSVIRVYDNRDFEFEISIDNLIGILMHSDVSKRDIMEECVFAWSGKNLVLLPVNSEEYRQAKNFTEKQVQSLDKKEFVKGHVYEQKLSEDHFVYIGKEDFYTINYNYQQNVGVKHVFYNLQKETFIEADLKKFARKISDTHPDFANLQEKFFKSPFHQIISDIDFKYDEYKVYKSNNYEHFLYKKISKTSFLMMHLHFNKDHYIHQNYICVSSRNININGNGITIDYQKSMKAVNEIIDKILQNKDLMIKNGEQTIYGNLYKRERLIDFLVKDGWGNQVYLTVTDGSVSKSQWPT